MRRIIVACVVMMLSGCTLNAPFTKKNEVEGPEQVWQQRQIALSALSEWAFRGRTVITQDREAWNAGVDWSQAQDAYTIRLLGPFAQGGAVLEGDNTGVTMQTSDSNDILKAQSPELLLAENLGWYLPVSALRDWVRGLPYQDLPVDEQQLNEMGQLVFLKQGGWEIQFKKYIPFEQYKMPAKVFMKHPELSVRVVISDWRRPND